jgi:hypothetical protein
MKLTWDKWWVRALYFPYHFGRALRLSRTSGFSWRHALALAWIAARP